MGKSIPRDVSFVTFDHPEDCFFEERKITYIEQPALQMGKAAARILVDLVESSEPAITAVTHRSRLIIGKSVLNLAHPNAQRAPA